jgi:hypothetical protein
LTHVDIILHHSNGDAAAAHAIANITMESKGESRPSRIHLPYWDVHKFRNDVLEARKFPKMLWKMLQELGYEKQPEYFGTQVTYGGSEPIWHVQVYIFSPKPLRGVYEVEKIHAATASRRSFHDVIRDAAHQAYMVIRSRHCQLLDGTECAHFPQRASGSAYIHVEHVQDEGNFKLKKQVALTATLTKELDSTTEEVEFWHGKYEEAMKTVQKMKRRYPQDLETFWIKRQKSLVHIHHLARWLRVHLLPTSFPMMLKARSSFSFVSFCME